MVDSSAFGPSGSVLESCKEFHWVKESREVVKPSDFVPARQAGARLVETTRVTDICMHVSLGPSHVGHLLPMSGQSPQCK